MSNENDERHLANQGAEDPGIHIPPSKEEIKAKQADAMAVAQKVKTTRPESVKSGVGILRQKGAAQSGKYYKSDIPYPEGVHGENFELYGPQGFASFIPEGTDIATYSSDQAFMIDPERVEWLFFQQAGRNLPKKRLYTIKGIHRDGRLRQLPYEDQIQNTAGGDPEDAIGIHRYQRKGIHMLIDWETMIPVYCGAWGCFAQAAQSGEFVAFCSMRHAVHTLPNKYKEGDQAMMGMFSRDSTTSRVWAG